MKCSDKWFRKEIQAIFEQRKRMLADIVGADKVRGVNWTLEKEILALLDERHAELQEKMRYLLEHRTAPCKIPHISDPNLKDRRFLSREDSAVYDLINEILGEFEPDQKEVKP